MSNKNLKIGKGLLYFDRNLSKYIEFDLEKNKTKYIRNIWKGKQQ